MIPIMCKSLSLSPGCHELHELGAGPSSSRLLYLQVLHALGSLILEHDPQDG